LVFANRQIQYRRLCRRSRGLFVVVVVGKAASARRCCHRRASQFTASQSVTGSCVTGSSIETPSLRNVHNADAMAWNSGCCPLWFVLRLFAVVRCVRLSPHKQPKPVPRPLPMSSIFPRITTTGHHMVQLTIQDTELHRMMSLYHLMLIINHVVAFVRREMSF